MKTGNAALPLDGPAILVLMHRDIGRVVRVVAEAEKLTADDLSLKTLNWLHRLHGEWAETLAFEGEREALRDALMMFTDAYHAQDAKLEERKETLRICASRYGSGQRLLVFTHFPETKHLTDRYGVANDVKADFRRRYEARKRLPTNEQVRLLREAYAAISNHVTSNGSNRQAGRGGLLRLVHSDEPGGAWSRVRSALREGLGIGSGQRGVRPAEPAPAAPTRKAEVVNETKRANNRLSGFVDTCLGIALADGTDVKAGEKLDRLWQKHEREFARNSALGRMLKTALEDFEAAWAKGADRDTLMEKAGEVEVAVATIRSERWRQVERKHGKIRHMFDIYGQIRPAYKVYADGAGSKNTL